MNENLVDAIQNVALAIVAVQVAALAIVKITPTQKDDAFLAKVIPWIERLTSFAAMFGRKPQ